MFDAGICDVRTEVVTVPNMFSNSTPKPVARQAAQRNAVTLSFGTLGNGCPPKRTMVGERNCFDGGKMGLKLMKDKSK